MELADRIVAISDALTRADIDHAFGGALALAFHVAEPRATRDIDLNIFCRPDVASVALRALPAGVRWSDQELGTIGREGQVRLFWDETPVDLFFSTGALHDQVQRRCRAVPFAGTTIPILSATDLVVFKACFDRTKDWADIEEMIAVRTPHLHEALGWLVDLLGSDDHRAERLRGLISTT